MSRTGFLGKREAQFTRDSARSRIAYWRATEGERAIASHRWDSLAVAGKWNGRVLCRRAGSLAKERRVARRRRGGKPDFLRAHKTCDRREELRAEPPANPPAARLTADARGQFL
jgi:hypothetical protein